MINLKRINGKEVIVNADLIESIESKPDTIITFTSGNKMVVLDSIPDIVKKVVEYKRQVSLKIEEKSRKLIEEAKGKNGHSDDSGNS